MMIGGLNSLLPARRLGQPAQEGTSLGLGEARHPELHEGLNTASTILYIVRSAARAIGDQQAAQTTSPCGYRVPYIHGAAVL